MPLEEWSFYLQSQFTLDLAITLMEVQIAFKLSEFSFWEKNPGSIFRLADKRKQKTMPIAIIAAQTTNIEHLNKLVW